MSREEEACISKIDEDYKIQYIEFVNIIMDFQIKLKDSYLKNFNIIFKKVDSDNDGIISEDQFKRLIFCIGFYGENSDNETDRLLNIADPFNNKQLTYSECVGLFSIEIIEDKDERGNELNTSLLDKLSVDDNIVRQFLDIYDNEKNIYDDNNNINNYTNYWKLYDIDKYLNNFEF